MISRIVVPLDGSQLSHAALPLARGLAEQTGAPVTLLSVMDPPRDFYVPPRDGEWTTYSASDINHLADEENRLQGYLNQIKSTFPDQTVHTSIRLGNAAEQILDEAESIRNSVVVMASHGRSGLGRSLLGSVASRVVRGGAVPVFVIRASEDSKAEYGSVPINKVAIPLDGSLIAEQALAAVHREFGSSVEYVLARVIEPVAPGQAYAPETIAEYDRMARENAERYLADVAERLKDDGARVAYQVRADTAANGIIAVATEVQADVIAMTTHGRTGIGRFLIGSVAERVLHQAEQPVMMVRAAEPESEQAQTPPLV